MLGNCAGCSRSLELYCPECPDCNIRHEGIVDWLRLNNSTWPTWAVPEDHQYLVCGASQLKRQIEAKFDDSQDYPNRIRGFLIRENALSTMEKFANPKEKTAKQLSEKKRARAIKVLLTPMTSSDVEQIMEERPELQDGTEVKILTPSVYKKKSNY